MTYTHKSSEWAPSWKTGLYTPLWCAPGGCNLECALSEMVVALGTAYVAPDWIILDFSQRLG